MMPVSLWSVIVSAIASMAIGSLWYGPLFGKYFMKETGMDAWSKEKQASTKKTMWMSYIGQLIASLVMFYVLAGIVAGFGHTTVAGGLLTGIIVWFGIVVPVKLGDILWGGNKTLFWLSIGNMFVTLLTAGAIIGAWN
jgi:hypothetical protein